MRGRGVLGCVGVHIVQEFYTLYGTKFRSTTLLDQWPPNDKKLRRGRGLSNINIRHRVLFQVTFKTKRFCIAFFLSLYECNDKNYGIEKKKMPLACMVVTGFPPHSWYKCTAKTKYRNFETNIPGKGIPGPQSQFSHSCVCEPFIYFHDLSPYSVGGNM